MALLADVHRLQLDIPAAVRAGYEGHAQARQHVRPEPAGAQRVGIDLRLRARLLDADLPVQRRLLADLRAGSRGAEPVALEVDRVAGAHARARQQLRADPGVRLRSLRLRHAPRPSRRRRGGRGGSLRVASESEKLPLGMMVPAVPAGVEIPPEPSDVGARALSVASRLLCGASTFFFLAFLFAYFYLRSINVDHMWRPAHVNPSQGWGAAFVACI